MSAEVGSLGLEVYEGNVPPEPLAWIVRSWYRVDGIEFVTPATSVYQLGVLGWPKGHLVQPHIHNSVRRQIDSTQEVLFVRRGRARLDLFHDDRSFSCSVELRPGDVAFLAAGGHGLEMLEPTEIIEVKQGPYLGEHEKTRFIPDVAKGREPR